MAIFIIGAGATRGASFVDSSKHPCLPPLDFDFFTQLQRVGNPKHKSLINAVISDLVDMFGTNFNLTLETVFTTLEHTLRMLGTTGETRDYKKVDLEKNKSNLLQAIAAVMEESLLDGITPRECDYHTHIVKNVMKSSDNIISFNYDCLIDQTLKQNGSGKWNPHYGYGFRLGSHGSNIIDDKYWMPTTPAKDYNSTIKLFKLHGSLHFYMKKPRGKDIERVTLKQRPYTKQSGNMKFTIIPPEYHKEYE